VAENPPCSGATMRWAVASDANVCGTSDAHSERARTAFGDPGLQHVAGGIEEFQRQGKAELVDLVVLHQISFLITANSTQSKSVPMLASDGFSMLGWRSRWFRRRGVEGNVELAAVGDVEPPRAQVGGNCRPLEMSLSAIAYCDPFCPEAARFMLPDASSMQ